MADYVSQEPDGVIQVAPGVEEIEVVHWNDEAVIETLVFAVGPVGTVTPEVQALRDEAVAAAGTATTKASQASTSASTATTQAGTATTKATEASTSATNAAASASSASTSAATATTKATEAINAAGALGSIFLTYSYSNASQTMADPGPGLFRLNNVTPQSATAIAIAADLLDASIVGPLIVARLQSTSAIKARLVISSGANRLEFKVTAVTNNTDWVQLTVTDGAIVGTIANGVSCRLVFEENGDKGSAFIETGVSIYKSDGVVIGTYTADEYIAADASLGNIFAKITAGTVGSNLDVYLEVNGAVMHGPFTVTYGTPVIITGSPAVAVKGNAIRVGIMGIFDGTVTEFFLKANGTPSA